MELAETKLERDVIIQECSGKTGIGIWEGMDQLVTLFENGGGVRKEQSASVAEDPSTKKDSKQSAENNP